MTERVQKYISQAGVASRRKAEEFIKSGQVTINGKKAKLGDKVDPSVDIVKVYGKIVKPAEGKIYLALNKPKDYVVTRKDPRGRKTIYSLLPEELKTKVWPVGRLDFETEGLLILTNDGDLTQELSHPKYEHEKEYLLSCHTPPTDHQLQRLRHGVDIESGLTAPAKAVYKNGKIYLSIHEGKNRQIRQMCAEVGINLKNLLRIRVGNYQMPETLATGKFVEIKKEQIL